MGSNLKTTKESKHSRHGENGIRAGVGLLALGLALAGVVFATARRSPKSQSRATPSASAEISRAFAKPLVAKMPQAPEPVQQGRRLTEWIEDLRTGDSQTKATAQEALIAMGAPAIPALGELLTDPGGANSAAWALAKIGKDSLPILLDALTNGATLARLEVAGVMSRFGPDNEEVVPALVDCMRYDDAGVRGNAIASLQSIPKRPDIAVPALNVCLTDPDDAVRGNAATVIRNYGQDAMPCVSNLVHLARHDFDSNVRTRAAESLRVIAPQRADKEGL